MDWPGREIYAHIELAQGAQLLLLGHSGSGKTTLLETVAGLIQLDTSSARTAMPGAPKLRVAWGKQVWCDTEQRKWVAPELRSLAVAFQTPRLFPHMTAEANVRFGLPATMAPEQRIAGAQCALQLVEAEGLAARKPAQLSGGEQMRVGLARALARACALEAPLVLLDEPLTGLERALAERIATRVQSVLRAHGATWIIATHHPALFRRPARDTEGAPNTESLEYILTAPSDSAPMIR
jgi:ABC-type Fe3+/spermidine/putrescine transport system ATPase subunit